jgi:hypothetical protein
MDELPQELLELIIEYCELAEALAFNLICKNCANVVNNNLQYNIYSYANVPKRFHEIKNLYIDFSRQAYHFDCNLPKLEILNIEFDNDFSDETLSKLINLKTLIIHYASEITNISISKLINLETISLGNNFNISHA